MDLAENRTDDVRDLSASDLRDDRVEARFFRKTIVPDRPSLPVAVAYDLDHLSLDAVQIEARQDNTQGRLFSKFQQKLAAVSPF